MSSHRTSNIPRWSILITALLLAFPTAASANVSGEVQERPAATSGLPTPLHRQALREAKSVSVALWPEYDRSDVLVIYRITLPDSVGLPARVGLPIPPGAPALTAVAYLDSTGKLVNAVNSRIDGDQADVVEVQTSGSEVQLEFYLPMRIDGDLRQFDFTWPGGLSTDSFEFEVQQPVDAQGMEVTPPPTSQTTDSAGLTYHRLDLGPQTAAARPEVGFSYRKDTAALSVDTTGAGLLVPPAPAGAASIDLQGALPWLVLLAGMALIGGGVIYYVRTRTDERPSRPRHRPAQPEERRSEVSASPVFCHNCGTQADASDRFCRRCGTALRT